VAHVLIVEDDHDVRPLLEHILCMDGYHVTAVANMTNALQLLGVEPFDLVLCDVNLPDGNGLTVADKAKEIGVKALVLTGYGLSLSPGVLARYDYLLKPLPPRELLDAMRQRLGPASTNVIPFARPRS
jgi:DNA-binding response OmpR family regulator